MVTADEHCRAAPAARLRPHIAWYTGYRQRGVPPAVHRGLPSPYLTVIFTLDEPMRITAHPDRSQPPGAFVTMAGGLHAAPALIEHDGAQSGIQVALRPLGARALLGLPAGELAWLDVPGDAVFGAESARITERLSNEQGWPGRFNVLDQAFSQVLRETTIQPEVSWAWRRLRATGGKVGIAALAAETGWSGRHLANRFRTEIGLTPKQAARVIRFDRTKRLLANANATTSTSTDVSTDACTATSRPRTLADLAVACGYADQAHLAREFRELAGCPPSQWLAEEFRNIQAMAWASGGSWDHD